MLELQELITEKQRREEHYSKYTPKESPGWDQVKIHKSNAPTLLIFGGNQSGKSMSASMEIVWRMRGKHPYKKVQGPPILAWCVSTSYATIQSGIWRHIDENIPSWEIETKGPRVQGYRMNSYIQLKNGSRVEFYSAKGYEEARERLQAAKVDVINIDEEIPEVVYDELCMRQLAAQNPVLMISATLVMSEPYILNLEERALTGDPKITLTRLDTEKNPYVNQEILKERIAGMDAETIAYRIRGESRRFAGLVYKGFHQTHIISPFDIPRTWPRYCAIDPGLRTFAVLWLTIGPNGRKYIYDELYLHGVSLGDVVDLIRIREGWVLQNKPITQTSGSVINKWKPGANWVPMQMRVIDDKRGSKFITGEWGVLEQLNLTYGIICIPAIKNKRIGIERCRQALTIVSDGKPETQIFQTCAHFIREIKTYRYRQDKSRVSQNETLQEPIKKLDHLLDCWRYLQITDPEWEEIDLTIKDEKGFADYSPSQDFSISDYREKMAEERNKKYGLVPVGDGCGGA